MLRQTFRGWRHSSQLAFKLQLVHLLSNPTPPGSASHFPLFPSFSLFPLILFFSFSSFSSFSSFPLAFLAQSICVTSPNRSRHWNQLPNASQMIDKHFTVHWQRHLVVISTIDLITILTRHRWFVSRFDDLTMQPVDYLPCAVSCRVVSCRVVREIHALNPVSVIEASCRL